MSFRKTAFGCSSAAAATAIFLACVAMVASPSEGAEYERLSRGTSVERTLPPGSSDRWVVRAKGDRRIEVHIVCKALAAKIRVLGFDGRTVSTWRLAPGERTEVNAWWVSEERGEWVIEIESEPGEIAARYELVMSQRRADPGDVLVWVADRLSDAPASATPHDLEELAQTARRWLLRFDHAPHRVPHDVAVDLEKLADEVHPIDPTLTEELLVRSLTLRRRAGESDRQVLDTLEGLAILRFNAGDFAGSERWEMERLKIIESTEGPDSAAAGAVLGYIATIRFKEGRYTEAAALLERAVPRLRNAREGREDLIAVLGTQAEVLRIQDRFGDAETVYQEALALARAEELENGRVGLDVLNNYAGLLKDSGRYAEAEVMVARVLRIQEEGPEAVQLDLETAYLNRAELLRLQGRFAEALPMYRRAEELARERLATHPELSVFLNQLGQAYGQLADLTVAESLYREALLLGTERLGASHAVTIQSQSDLGRLLSVRGDHEQARAHLEQALELREETMAPGHPDIAWSLTELARALALAGPLHDAEARAAVGRAISIFERTSAHPQVEIEARALQAELFDRGGDRVAAIAALSSALDLIEEVRTTAGSTELGSAFLFGSLVEHFDRMVLWEVQAGRAERGFVYTERRRARALLDRLARTGSDANAGIPDEVISPLLERESRLKLRLAELQAQLDSARSPDADPMSSGGAERRIAGLESEVGTSLRLLDEVYGEMDQARLKGTRKNVGAGQELVANDLIEQLHRRVLGSETYLVSYEVGLEASHVFLIAPGSGKVDAWSLSVDQSAAAVLGADPGPLTRAHFEAWIAPHGELMVGGTSVMRGLDPTDQLGSTIGSVETLAALFRVLVPDPLWERVRAASEVILIPDGALYAVPFEALVVDAETVRYWLDDGPVLRYAPSVASLVALTDRSAEARPPASVLIVADPVFDVGSERAASRGDGLLVESASRGASRADADLRSRALKRLTGTALEAKEIRGALEGKQVVVLDGPGATEAAVRVELAKEPAFVHFATHGLVDERQGSLMATLALTPPLDAALTTDNDGFLRLFEIYRLSLASELVVLSACETMRGTGVAGEGVFALARGFIAAGAVRVVASLWPVDDASTATLMGEFYRSLERSFEVGGNVSYARALRDARRAMRSRPEWSSPYYWAPFLLVGAE